MITVIGLGFVGLTTALGFAYKGFSVYGFDIDKEKVNLIKNGEIPFYEPFLKDVLTQNINKCFFILDDLKEAVEKSEVIFYCVGTPEASNGHAELKYIFDSIQNTLRHIKKDEFKVLVIKSTVPPSSTKEKIKPFIERLGYNVGRDIGLTNNPEFLREGNAWKDFIEPDRVVIGEDDPKSGSVLENLFKPFNVPVFRVSLNTAEFIKYLSNTFLATMISFSNEMSMAAYAIGDIDIQSSFKILHRDRRWSGSPANMTSYVYPGCGFGGYCLPKDLNALLSLSIEKGYTPNLLKEVANTNTRIKDFVAKKIIEAANTDEYIGILGLSFKPGSDDVRDTPSKYIIEKILDSGYKKIVTYDPLATDNFKREYPLPIEFASSFKEFSEKISVVAILTAWKEFLEKKHLLNGKKILDFRYYLS